MNSSKNKRIKRSRRLGFPQLPMRLFIKKPGRHARRYEFSLMGKKRALIIRTFRTSSATRSKRLVHHTLQLTFLNIREISYSYKKAPQSPHYLKIPSKQVATGALSAVFITSSLIFGTNLAKPANIQPAVKAAAYSTKSEPVKTAFLPASEPTELIIPSIGVDATVVKIGLDEQGALSVPSPTEVGWYQNSPTPGEVGPSIIDGHLDWIDNIAVFWRLREMSPGDSINVARADGTTANFKVDAVEEYPQSSFPVDKVYGKIYYAGIRLITCGGTFNYETHHYSDNIVVYGSLVK